MTTNKNARINCTEKIHGILTDEQLELEHSANVLRSMRPDLLKLKPRYPKRGRPTKAEWLAAGKPLTRAQWTELWRREGPGWGGKRPGSGSLPKGKTSVRMDFTINLEMAEKLEKLPSGAKSRFVNKALELLFMMEPPPEKKPLIPPRGRHAHKDPDWKQERPARMTKLELARHKLELARAKIAEAAMMEKELAL